jgi:hypothetical protein
MALESTAALAAPQRGRARARSRQLGVAALQIVRQIPFPLGLLTGVAVVAGVVWCIALPPLQGPDEVGHFAYVQTIGETGSIPWHLHQPANFGLAYSTEVGVAGRCSGITGLAQNVSARAPASVVDERVCYAALNRLPHGARSDGGFTSAEKNPPLYYLYQAVPYVVFKGSTFFTRAFVMRLANLPLLVALAVFVWLLSGELLLGLPRGPALRSLATAAAVLNPQTTMLTATINPDLLLATLWAAGLWLAVSIVRRGATRTRVVWLACTCAAAALTHGRGLALIPAALLALAIAAWRRYRPRRRLAAAAIGAGVMLMLGGVFAVVRYAVKDDVTLPRVRAFLSYLWQFYLPRLGSMKPTIHPGYGVRQVFIDRFLGTFAQLEVMFSTATLNFLSRAAEVTAVAVLVALVFYRRKFARAGWVVVVLAVGALGYLLQLHAAAYSSLLEFPGDPIITGRYLLPLLALYGIGIALAVSWLPRRLSAALSGAVLTGLVVLQFSALAIVVERFYV